MKPLKVRDLLPSFAMEMSRPVDEVQAVVSFYYKTLRASLSSLEAPCIQVENLGNFYIKTDALKNTIEQYTIYHDRLSDNLLSQYERKLKAKNLIDRMKNMTVMLDAEKERRRAVINKRFNNEPEKKHHPDLEK